MEMNYAPIIAAIVVGAISGAITALIAFRSFQAMDAQRELARARWSGEVDGRLDRHATRLEKIPVIEEQLRQLEESYRQLHFFKSQIAPAQLSQQYTTITELVRSADAELSKRLDRLEQKIFGGRQ
jgi:hypothetical protein